MLIRSLFFASLVSTAAAGFAEDTCKKAEWTPQDNTESPTGRVRCCAGNYDDDKYASCDTSSCPNNFNAKNHNCFNYGSPEHPISGNGRGKPTTGDAPAGKGGSNICPYFKSDKAICDTSFYDAINPVACRTNPAGTNTQVHCLGKVKCQSAGVTVPQRGHSDGTDGTHTEGGACLSTEFPAGTDCFYDGFSENWKVCGGPPDAADLAEAEEEVEAEVKSNPEEEVPVVKNVVEEPVVEEPVVEEPVVEEPEPQVAALVDEVMTETSKPGAKGDPHFKTHGGEMYDFHGGCDLVLLDNPDFHGGLGMLVHIRTKIETWWSYVESAVVRIGDETLEIKEGGLFTNGVAIDMESLENEKFYLTEMSGLQMRYMQSGSNLEAHIYLGNGEKLLMKTFKGFVKVEMAAEGSEYYKGSHGLLGRFPDGKRVGRDGETFIEDVNAFGQEWQVLPEEPKLFHTYEGEWVVPAGQKCAMPTETLEKKQLRQRRLANGMALQEAEKACSHLESADDRKACVFDVVSTQDVNMASVW